MNHTPAIGLIACDVFSHEITIAAGNATHILHRKSLPIGLHDRPNEMYVALQAAIDEMDNQPNIEAIVLGYGLCGLGTAGLSARKLPLVIPRAHDCITVFLGSKERCAEHRQNCHGCYHYTSGWNRARRVPGPDRIAALHEEYTGTYNEEDVNFLLESERSMWSPYHTATFIDTGTSDATAEAAYAQSCADWLGWKFEIIPGDPSLLHDLLRGVWDEERFQIIHPGHQLAHSPDSAIMRTKPCP
jgi:hypothetical protein